MNKRRISMFSSQCRSWKAMSALLARWTRRIFAVRNVRPSALCAVVIASVLQVGCDSKSTLTVGSAASSPAKAGSLTARAEAGDSAAMIALARAHELGTDGSKKDELLAFKWYARAADAGLPKAMAEVAKRYREGRGVREDFEASVRWADKGAELGDADAIYLSTIRGPWDLFLGWESVIDSESEEAKLIRDSSVELNRLNRAADAGSVDAKLRLGQILRAGVWYQLKDKRKVATAPETDRAVKSLVDAAGSGSAIATLELAQWYQKGGDGLKADTSLASKYWDRTEGIAAPEGQFAIGHELQPSQRKYYKARLWRDQVLTYEQASWKAREWLEKAARQGHAQAALDLGNMLSSDQYGYSDEAKAFGYLMQAAESELVGGQTAVSWAYFKGLGVAKNYTHSFTWALRAATHPTAAGSSMAGAQRFVAYLLSQGLGVEKDVVLAYAWANVSAATGDKEAKEILTNFDRILDTSQIREAQQISSSWKLGEDMTRVVGVASAGTNVAASAPDVGVGADVKLAGSGTGFFISTTGILVTNFHVAGKCAKVKLPALTKTATVLSTDAANDLAVLRVAGAPEVSARLADPSKLRQGQEIAAFGYPLDGYLPSAGNITTGLVSALSGPANNSSLIQISAPVQQGNSGGPVLNTSGEVVGVVVGKADVIRIAKVTGDILQNVNFAVSAGTLQGFLDANRIVYRRSSYFSLTKKPEALADEARQFTVKVECWR